MRVLFRAAAGPRVGFGHLVRCRSLARALDVPAVVSLRATTDAAWHGTLPGIAVVSSDTSVLDGPTRPHVLVIDDPSVAHTEAWVRQARMRGIGAVTIGDLGRGSTAGDLSVDGSIDPRTGRATLAGPRYAVLDPSVAAARALATVGRAGVVIALGGGAHVHAWGASLALAIQQRLPHTPIRIIAGFARRRASAEGLVQWVNAPGGLVNELRRAAAAVVAGGVTMYEAAALGAPIVGLAVVPAQEATLRGFARQGAAVAAGLANQTAARERAADAVMTLVTCRSRAARFGATAARLVDGQGAFRVAGAIRDLVDRKQEHIDAA